MKQNPKRLRPTKRKQLQSPQDARPNEAAHVAFKKEAALQVDVKSKYFRSASSFAEVWQIDSDTDSVIEMADAASGHASGQAGQGFGLNFSAPIVCKANPYSQHAKPKPSQKIHAVAGEAETLA